jgi:DMSO/TMAO reductase YedYZ molybdopterin-dependent catalytic subunit
MTTPVPKETEPAASPDVWRPTPLPALELEGIPTELHFVRDHFGAPAVDPASWSLTVTGSARSIELSLERLRDLPARALNVVLECAGHRRAEFDPLPDGLPWECGAVAEARWSGARLGAVLELAGVPADARELVLEGADAGPVDGFPGVHRFARSLPIAKAFDPDVLLAYEMNGKPITLQRGGPVRAIVPGWYATDSVKWVDRIWFTEAEFDGVFQAHDYRLSAPGEPGPGARMTELPVNALITSPVEGEENLFAGRVVIRGIAWGGADGIAQVLVRLDGGPWTEARLGPVRGAYARVGWELPCAITPGIHELTCRAIDRAGRAQPDRPTENVRGYANNAVHRISIRARL